MEYIQELRKLVGTRPLILNGAAVIVINEKSEILLHQRPDGDWGLPGGLLDLGETLEETARREVKEETGLLIGELRLIHVFSGPDFFVKVSNGDEFYSVTTLYLSREIIGGQLVADGIESMDVRFFPFKQVPTNIKKNHKTYLNTYLSLIK